MTEQIMQRIPDIDAITAYILGTAENSTSVVDAVCRALEQGFVSPRFVEAYAKGPNVSWPTLAAYWQGVLGDAKGHIHEGVTNSLAEALYAQDLEVQGAEVELQYRVGRNYIDLRVKSDDPLTLKGVEDCRPADTQPVFYTLQPTVSLAIDFKAYSAAYSYERGEEKIRTEIRVGKKTMHTAAIATVDDFWAFRVSERRHAFDLVTGEGALLLTATWRKADVENRATVILSEGRKLHGR